MIKRAYLVGGLRAVPDDQIGGLPILLRQALSLQDAGIDDIVLVGVSALSLRADPRLRIAVHEMPGAPTQSVVDAIVAPAGCVWHPAIARRLARMPIGPSEWVGVGSGTAVVYACGRLRVAEIVGLLATATAPPGVEGAPVAPRPPEFVIVPRTASERRTATTCLLQSLEKPTDGIASRHLHRPISLAITRRLLPYRITPNQMTLAASVFGVAGVAMAFRGGYWPLLAGAALFETQNILDGCDGEIARLTYLRSRAGEWLDQVIDDVLNIAFLSCVGFALARQGHPYAWWLAFVSLVFQVVHVAGLYSGLILKAGGRGNVATLRWWVGGNSSAEAADGPVRPVRLRAIRTAGDLTRRDFIAVSYLVCTALNIVSVIFVWHVAVTIGSALVTTLQWIAWGGPDVQSADDVRADAASEVPA